MVGFCQTKWTEYPNLAKVAQRVSSTHASSSENERDFSHMKPLLRSDKTPLAKITISDIYFVEYALK